MPEAVSSYAVVEALHVIAVLVAFGVPLAYPVLLPYLRRKHARSLPAVHAAQLWMNQRLTAPGTVALLALGAYMATKDHLWGETWVQVPVAIVVVIGGVGGAVIVPSSRRMAELARADVEAAAAGPVTWSDEYERVYARYLRAEVLLGALVLVAVFFMTARPFA